MAVDSVPEEAPSAPPMDEVPPSGPHPKLNEILNKMEITIVEANELAVLEDYDLVVIADDSGSMNLSCVPLNQRVLGSAGQTRWGELSETLTMILELATCVIPNPVDVFFLNQPPILGVTSSDDERLAQAFKTQPYGGTPLTETLRSVVARKAGSERPVLVLIATDGEPTSGPADFKKFVRSTIARRDTDGAIFKFQILACTDDDDAVGWLDKFDREFKEVDVTDDFATERAQILQAGKVEHFRRSDWVIKALLGSIISKFDNLDEPDMGTKVMKEFDWRTVLVYLLILVAMFFAGKLDK
eukprot:TRINITY_DN9440_c0_g1_i1.p1 TRINITY_DN9440_c0_g1~~TRINITY_DN9440_c0_g1_i1.p1  ORF type:complete len:300 (+),score=96.13 TRINITY_DN9440_c0_g1_i1:1477-2376(+)